MPGLFDALIQQESGGRPGVVGPKTKYGRALGLTQMLPATAQEMARKIGVPFNQSMLTDKSPQGAAYQRQLGEAYFNEGLQRTGNERDALRYYHGGPNRAQWGPKTNQYADSVMARAGGNSMIRPRKPQAKAPMQPPAQMAPMPLSGPDPLAPQAAPMQPLGIHDAPLDPASLGSGADLGAMPDKVKKGGIFGSGLNGWDLLGIAGDCYLLAHGQEGAYTKGRREESQMQFDREKFNQELAAKRVAATQPKLEQVGNTIGMVDQSTGAFTPTYTGPENKTSLQQNIDYLRQMKPDMTNEEIAAIVQQNITNPIMPRMVTYAQGDQTITEEIGADGKRKPVASAPRWAPKTPAPRRAAAPPSGFILD